MAEKKYAIIYTTCSGRTEALKIGQALVSEKLAACANIFPLFSIYRWKGRVEKAKEFGVILKTKSRLVRRAMAKIKELHSYETPAILSFYIAEGSSNYLRWIDESTE